MTQATAEAAVSILVGPAKFRVQSAPEAVHDILDDSLAYEYPDAQWSDAYQSGRWDGKQRLYDRSDHTAAVGLLGRAQDTLESEGYSVEVTDDRGGPGKPIETEWNFDHPLREYQREAVESAHEAGGGIVSLPTGAGKTVVALRMIHDVGRRSIVFVHTKELLYQWCERIRDVLDVEPGMIGDGNSSEGPVTVAIMDSLVSQGTEDLADYGVVVMDECHRTSAADTFHEAGQSVDAAFRVGLSATPWRRVSGEEMKIEGAVGSVAFEKVAPDLIEAGHLARPEWKTVDPADFGEQDTPYAGDDWSRDLYTWNIVECTARNDAIADTVTDLANDGRSVLVPVDRKRHGEMLETRLSGSGGVTPAYLCGEHDADRRHQVLGSFGSGDVNVLITTLVKEGVDLPSINAVVLACGGKSSVKLIQIIGRALRPENGETAIVVDLRDRGKYFGEHFESRQEAFRDYYGGFGPGVDPGVQKVRGLLESKGVDTDPLTVLKEPDGSVRIEITGDMADSEFYHYTDVRRETDGMHFDPDAEVNRVPDPNDLPDSGEW